jgi:hypothetical protein
MQALGLFTLDCDFGGRLGVAGFWVQRLPPKVPPEWGGCEEFEQSEAEAFFSVLLSFLGYANSVNGKITHDR